MTHEPKAMGDDSPVRPASEPPTAARVASLEGLLCELFPSYRTLYRFLHGLPDSSRIVSELPHVDATDSMGNLVFAVAAVLTRRGVVDHVLFERLVATFPGRRRDISRVAAQWGCVQQESAEPVQAALLRKRRGRMWIALGGGGLGAALLLSRSIFDRGEDGDGGLATARVESRELAPGSPATAEARPDDAPASEMALIPGGIFRMGVASSQASFTACIEQFGPRCPRELFDRQQATYELGPVTIETFMLDRVEVSNGAFARWLNRQLHAHALTVRGRSVWTTDTPAVLLARLTDAISFRDGVFSVPGGEMEDRPVVGVTWDAAERYCRREGKRLPSPAEWEFAARGPAGRDMVCELCAPTCADIVFGRAAFAELRGACEDHPSGPQALEAGPLDVTPEGVSHLAGNASEWVEIDPRLVDPQRPCPGDQVPRCRVFRGGSWQDPLVLIRPSLYSRAPASSTRDYVGFRCAGPHQD